jgi:site-specific recombinase XerD
MKSRAADSPWIFPSKTDHALPADKKRNGLLAAIAKAGVKPFAWHHLRHYFISQAVMAGIDYRTIAEWVGHRDGGVLIGKVYSHLNSKHQERMASKLTFGQESAAKAA